MCYLRLVRAKGIIKNVNTLQIESSEVNEVAYDWSISKTERNKKVHAYNGNSSSTKKITDFFGSKPENEKPGFKCEVCGKVCKSLQGLQSHQSVGHICFCDT